MAPSASTSLALDPLGTVSTVAGGGASLGDGGPATSAQLASPSGVAVDAVGNVYIADSSNNRVRKIGTDGTITTIAGTGVGGFSGDGGPATGAQLRNPSGVAVDAAGNVYIADYSNDRVRKVTTGGTITTIAGTGVRGFSGDGGPATSADINLPFGVVVDATGNVFFTTNRWVRKVSTDGTISTVAGGGSSLGDGGPATNAQLTNVTGLAIDAAGNIFIADTNPNNRVRKVSTGGTITTIAGTGVLGFSGDGGPATSAQLDRPFGVAVDATGNVYIALFGSHRVRKVATDGTITTVAGTGALGFSGDGGPASNAQLSGPQGVAVDPAGNLYIADTANMRIRKVLLAAPPSGLVPLASRLFDTRPGTAAGAIAVPKQSVTGGSFLEVQLTGNAGIPGSGVGSVVLNVTAVNPTAGGFVTVYPCGTRPGTSNLNYTSGQTVANTVITPVSAAGKVCFYAEGTTHLIADLSGWFPTGQGLNSSGASRLFDTRPGTAAGAIAVPKQ
ncbi:MAG: NHL repeat-containing protein, partial [Ilumatobacteraceae bacterium]